MFIEKIKDLLFYLKTEEVSPQEIEIGDIVYNSMQGLALVEDIKIISYPLEESDKSKMFYEFANDPTYDSDYRHIFVVRGDKKVSRIPRSYLNHLDL
jgi:hypothetical protein